jgi:hypothetical protein
MQGAADQSSADLIDELVAYITPHVVAAAERINVAEFTTVEFIAVMQLDPDIQRAYDEALTRWPERDTELAKLVIHGQVIPQALRRSGLVEWAGFAYGEDDPYAVPAWWRKVENESLRQPRQ